MENQSNSPFILIPGLRETIRVREDGRIEGDSGWSRIATDEEEAMYVAIRNMRETGNAGDTVGSQAPGGLDSDRLYKAAATLVELGRARYEEYLKLDAAHGPKFWTDELDNALVDLGKAVDASHGAQAPGARPPLLDMLVDAHEAYCSLNCPSVKKAGAEWPHTDRCKEMRKAIAAAEGPAGGAQ